jgi:hypothetical protein
LLLPFDFHTSKGTHGFPVVPRVVLLKINTHAMEISKKKVEIESLQKGNTLQSMEIEEGLE